MNRIQKFIFNYQTIKTETSDWWFALRLSFSILIRPKTLDELISFLKSEIKKKEGIK